MKQARKNHINWPWHDAAMTLRALMSGLLARCESALDRALRGDASGLENRDAARSEFINIRIIETPVARDPDGRIGRSSLRD